MNFESTLKRIDEKAALDFGSIFNRSLELFKKVWLQGFITVLLTFICILPFYILIYVPLIAAGITDPEMLQQEELPLSVALAMIFIMPIFLIGVMMSSLGLMAAFLRICRLHDSNELGSDDYFFYFKNGRMLKLFKLTLIYFGAILLAFLTCGLGLIYAMVPLSLVPAFLAFNEELSALEIIKASIRLGNKNWFMIFGLMIVMGFIAELGIFLCCIGIFFTVMLAKIPVYFIYKDGVGFSETGESLLQLK